MPAVSSLCVTLSAFGPIRRDASLRARRTSTAHRSSIFRRMSRKHSRFWRALPC